MIFTGYLNIPALSREVGDEMEAIGLMTDYGHIVLLHAVVFSPKGMGHERWDITHNVQVKIDKNLKLSEHDCACMCYSFEKCVC